MGEENRDSSPASKVSGVAALGAFELAVPLSDITAASTDQDHLWKLVSSRNSSELKHFIPPRLPREISNQDDEAIRQQLQFLLQKVQDCSLVNWNRESTNWGVTLSRGLYSSLPLPSIAEKPVAIGMTGNFLSLNNLALGGDTNFFAAPSLDDALHRANQITGQKERFALEANARGAIALDSLVAPGSKISLYAAAYAQKSDLDLIAENIKNSNIGVLVVNHTTIPKNTSFSDLLYFMESCDNQNVIFVLPPYSKITPQEIVEFNSTSQSKIVMAGYIEPNLNTESAKDFLPKVAYFGFTPQQAQDYYFNIPGRALIGMTEENDYSSAALALAARIAEIKNANPGADNASVIQILRERADPHTDQDKVKFGFGVVAPPFPAASILDPSRWHNLSNDQKSGVAASLMTMVNTGDKVADFRARDVVDQMKKAENISAKQAMRPEFAAYLEQMPLLLSARESTVKIIDYLLRKQVGETSPDIPTNSLPDGINTFNRVLQMYQSGRSGL